MKPISKTAFYCCGVRMQDAERDKSVCGDNYAKAFMNEEALQILETFKNENRPNISNVARHRLIDDLLRDDLLAHPNLTVLLIGAGFDSRAFRLKGGTWIELDEPQVITYKNERLPASESKNELQRIPIDFAADSLEQKLTAFANRSPVTIVIEGVLMYLEEPAIRKLLETLRRLFPHHKLICDLMTRDFFEKNATSIHEKLTGLGAVFKFTIDNPEDLFLQNGYTELDKFEIVQKAVHYEAPYIPKSLWQLLRLMLPSGYTINVFEI